MTRYYNHLTDTMDDATGMNPYSDKELIATAIQHWGFDTDAELEAMQERATKAYWDYVNEVGDDNISVIWADHLSRAMYYPRIVLWHRHRTALRAKLAARRAEAQA